MEYTDVMLIQYVLSGVESTDEGKNERRFVASSAAELKDGLVQLEADIEKKYPLSEYPDRKFSITGVYREVKKNINEICAEINDSTSICFILKTVNKYWWWRLDKNIVDNYKGLHKEFVNDSDNYSQGTKMRRFFPDAKKL